MKLIQSIVVCGAGTMGSGIAQVAIQAGIKTIQFDLSEDALIKSKVAIDAQLSRSVEKGKITQALKDQYLSLLHFTSVIADCKADLIIEAIIENKEIKIALFKQLAAINEPTTILASNTSSISIDEIANGLNDPSIFIGMHFFNPAPVMKLVEVIKGNKSSPEAIQLVMNLTKAMGKVPVLCNDAPGFIVNRVARHYYLEAMEMVQQGSIDIESVDAIMEAAGFKMGPFKLMDLIGMDINYSVSNIVWEALGKPLRLIPSTLQKEKVDSGQLGKKSGQGFYKY